MKRGTLYRTGAALLAVAAGCDQQGESPEALRGGELAETRRPAKAGCDSPVGDAARNDEVRLALEEHCAGCHSAGATGYFASLTAFQNLLVADSRLVVPGDPDASELLRLLEGSGSGSVPQMPLGMESFADLDERGVTAISIDEIRDWITDLEVNGVASASPDHDAPTVRKLSAGHIEFGLRELLGLTRDDFYSDASTYGVLVDNPRSRGDYPVHDPDATPGSFRSEPVDNFYSLGGASAVHGIAGDPNFTPPLVQTLVPLSQSWCAMAVAKEANDALFGAATAETGSDSLAAVRENIASMHLHFLGVQPRSEDVDKTLEEVFVPLEAETQDTATAWAGVCSYYVRHPQFLLF